MEVFYFCLNPKQALTLVNMDVNLMTQREVMFYRTSGGACPVEDFLDQLSSKDARKVTWVLSLLEDLDRIPVQYFIKMSGTDDIWECRIRFGSNIYRIFAFWDQKKIILTHGLVKKTQKTPAGEIQRAEKYKKDYFANQRRSA